MKQNNFDESIKQICNNKKITISTLQREFDLGFSSAGTILYDAVKLKLIREGNIISGYTILKPTGLRFYLHKAITKAIGKLKTTSKTIDEKIDAICLDNMLFLHDLQQSFQLSFAMAGDILDDLIAIKLIDKNGTIKDGFRIFNAKKIKSYLSMHLYSIKKHL